MVSQAATVRLKARNSNNIKAFIVSIIISFTRFSVELTGFKTGKILDFSPIFDELKAIPRGIHGPVFRYGERTWRGFTRP